MGRRWIAAGAVLGVAVFIWQTGPSLGVRTSETETPEPLYLTTQWPPFVARWRVTAEPTISPRSVMSPAFGRNPCAVVGTDTCFVRLAWRDLRAWSLTASPDPVFDDRDPRQFTDGTLHYGIDGGIVQGMLPHDRVPPLHICQRLERARRAGGPVSMTTGNGTEIQLRDARGDEAECRLGIPRAFLQSGVAWQPIALELRAPTADEIGSALVRASAVLPPERACGSGRVFSATTAGSWLLDLAGRRGGFPAAPAGSGIVLEAPTSTGTKTVFAWATAAGTTEVPPGARTRMLSGGAVVSDLLEPVPVVSIDAGDLRIWLTFGDRGDRSRTMLEADVFALGEMAKLLRGASYSSPYRGLPPAGSPVIPNGGEAIQVPEDHLRIEQTEFFLPDPDRWLRRAETPGGSPTWEAAAGGELLVLTGGRSLVVSSPEPTPVPTLALLAEPAIESIAACPIMGMTP